MILLLCCLVEIIPSVCWNPLALARATNTSLGIISTLLYDIYLQQYMYYKK